VRHVAVILLAAFALTACQEDTRRGNNAVPAKLAPLVREADGDNWRLSGIGSLFPYGCTTWLLDTGRHKGPAYALTAGHCTPGVDPTAVVVDYELDELWDVTLRDFVDAQDSLAVVPVARIAYATMKDTDLAVLELDATLEEVTTQGAVPLTISRRLPPRGERTSIIGVRREGVPFDRQHLRRSSCRFEGIAPRLVEGAFLAYDELRSSCSAAGGNSGSPYLLDSTGEVLGLVSTGTFGSHGLSDCDINRPCEVGENDARSREAAAYAVPIQGLHKCFGNTGLFSLSPPCPLDTGRQFVPEDFPPPANPELPGAPKSWTTRLIGNDLTHYRLKIGPIEETDCRDPSSYGSVRAWSQAPLITVPLWGDEGIYAACILGGPGSKPDGSWQPPRFATPLVFQIDQTPPLRRPKVDVTKRGDGWMISLRADPPELSSYRIKIGRPDEVDCDEPKGYAPYRASPRRVSRRTAPRTVCVIGLDEAGNASDATRRTVR
jgi:hypothetical protein